MHWLLPWRNVPSEGVHVEECEPRVNAHCSKLLVRNLIPNDTGLYSCRYARPSADISSTYVYVKGETRFILFRHCNDDGIAPFIHTILYMQPKLLYMYMLTE